MDPIPGTLYKYRLSSMIVSPVDFPYGPNHCPKCTGTRLLSPTERPNY